MVATATSRRLFVPPPSVTPLPFGLMSVVQRPNEDPPASLNDGDSAGKWQNGVQYQPWPCDDLHVAAGPCVTPHPLKTETSEGRVTRASDPFTLYAWIECAPTGGFLAQAEEVTRAALNNNEGRAVERAFWTGIGQASEVIYPHLAANAEVDDGSDVLQTAATVLNPTPGTPVNVVRGVALLESALGSCYGSSGIIHAPSGVLAHLRSEGTMAYPKPSDTQLLTWAGHKVAVGAGYPGTAPDGTAAAAGQTWMYATGAVMLRRSDVSIGLAPREIVGRDQNTTVMIAERTYTLGWDCCHFAVLVALAEPVSGTV